MFCSLYLLTFHSASLPTLEMTSGETATFLQAGGVVRSLNSSGHGLGTGKAIDINLKNREYPLLKPWSELIASEINLFQLFPT